MRAMRAAILIRMPTDLADALKERAAIEGESVGSIIRGLARQAIARGETGVRPLGESVRPLSRADK